MVGLGGLLLLEGDGVLLPAVGERPREAGGLGGSAPAWAGGGWDLSLRLLPEGGGDRIGLDVGAALPAPDGEGPPAERLDPNGLDVSLLPPVGGLHAYQSGNTALISLASIFTMLEAV